MPQRYPTHVLRLECERELDVLLKEQVYERERAHRFLLEQDNDDLTPSDSSDDDDQEDANHPRQAQQSSKAVRARASDDSIWESRFEF